MRQLLPRRRLCRLILKMLSRRRPGAAAGIIYRMVLSARDQGALAPASEREHVVADAARGDRRRAASHSRPDVTLRTYAHVLPGQDQAAAGAIDG
jgi:hypothetical protein